MARIVDVKPGIELDVYELYSNLYWAVREFRKEAELSISNLKHKRICMINSTEQGGGVAEMLPPIINISKQFDLDIDWVVIESNDDRFFAFTKKIHNLIHGKGDPKITDEERSIYENISKENAESLIPQIKDGDLLVIHDPQPMGMAKYIKKERDVIAIWRCHIGLDVETKETRAAWEFLKPYFDFYDHNVFTVPEYIPNYITGNVTTIPPGIDPLSHKNRVLPVHKLTGILRNAGLVPDGHPKTHPPFSAEVKRLQRDGSWQKARECEDIGLFYRPVVTQISRWDRLKGFVPLMKGFSCLKQQIDRFIDDDKIHRNRIKNVRLVLGGPDPESIKDDPEGIAVLEELKEFFVSLSEEIQEDIVLLTLPMESVKENALIVNALQRCSSIVVQNSLQEGFGLTVTEALWKAIPVMGTNACGIRHQIRDDIDGKIVSNPEDPEEIAVVMNYMLKNSHLRTYWGYSGQKHMIDEYMIFSQMKHWIHLIAALSEE